MIHLTVAAIIEKQGKFLLVEESVPDSDVSVFNQPAGHVEDGETIVDAVIRETLEETAWHFKPRLACGIYHWQHPNSDIYIRHCFAGEVTDHEPGKDLDTGIISADWFSLEEIRQQAGRHRSPLVLQCITDYLQGNHYPLELYREL